jgi:hypothetical protein
VGLVAPEFTFALMTFGLMLWFVPWMLCPAVLVVTAALATIGVARLMRERQGL